LIVSGEDGYKAGLRLTGIGLNRVSLAKSVSYAPPDKGWGVRRGTLDFPRCLPDHYGTSGVSGAERCVNGAL